MISDNLAFSSSVNLFPSLLFLIILTITVIVVILSLNTDALGQTSSSSVNTTQQAWIDKLNNLKIQFSYLPEKPTADDTIQLQFSIQNLQTGSHLKNITAKVTIFNDPIYKYDNITVADGDFSIRRLFLDSGMLKVFHSLAHLQQQIH